MSNNIVITADSSADLPIRIREELGIHHMRIPITLEGKTGLDCVDIFPMDIYEAFKTRGAIPKTAAPSPTEYKEFFEGFTSQGAVVVHLSISSKLSSCHNFACMGAEEAQGEVIVVDTRNFCIGQGLLCVIAARLRDKGLPAAEIAAQTEAARAKIKSSYYLHGLDFLSKSGRCPSVVAAGATLLNLHPSISVDAEKGEVVIGKKYRGKNAPENWLRDNAAKLLDSCDPALLIYGHTPEIAAEQAGPMDALAKELFSGFEQLIVISDELGCTVISHVGGGCYGMAGIEK